MHALDGCVGWYYNWFPIWYAIRCVNHQMMLYIHKCVLTHKTHVVQLVDEMYAIVCFVMDACETNKSHLNASAHPIPFCLSDINFMKYHPEILFFQSESEISRFPRNSYKSQESDKNTSILENSRNPWNSGFPGFIKDCHSNFSISISNRAISSKFAVDGASSKIVWKTPILPDFELIYPQIERI